MTHPRLQRRTRRSGRSSFGGAARQNRQRLLSRTCELLERRDLLTVDLPAVFATANPSPWAAADGAPLLSIATTANGNEAGPVNGLFTVTLSAASASETVINYSIEGAAFAGSDFEALNGTVTIAAGETTATIDVLVIDDDVFEPAENVLVTLTGISSGEAQIEIDPAQNQAEVVITDNEVPRITLEGSFDAEEGSPFVGVFTVRQSHPTSSGTTVNYTVTGTATSGADFASLSGTVTIPPGLVTQTIIINVVDDGIIENSETVVVTLGEITTGDPRVQLVPESTQATINVLDNDLGLLSIARLTDGNEATPAAAIFTITQSAVSSTDTVVAYQIAGTATADVDFTAPSGTATIVAGARTASITTPVLGDTLVEADETIIVTLGSVTQGNPAISVDPTRGSISAKIIDDDAALVSLAATASGDESGPVPGSFTVTLSDVSATETVVHYSLSGTATSGSDYTSLTGLVTIPAGQTSATIDVIVIDDDAVEGVETVAIELTTVVGDEQLTIDPAAKSAQINLADNDTNYVSIALTLDASEDGPTQGRFTVSQIAAVSTDTVVALFVQGAAISGTDFVALPVSVTIPAGSTSAIVAVDVIDDSLLEGDETLRVDLDGIVSGDAIAAIDNNNRLAIMTIADDDQALATVAKNSDAAEGGAAGRFTVSLSTASPSDTVLTFALSGSAGSGSDYDDLGATVLIPAGILSVTIDVPAFDDLVVEGEESVELTLSGVESGNPQVVVSPDGAAATLAIADNDSALVSIAKTTNGLEAGPTSGVFTVTQSAVSATDTVIQYTVGGTATAGGDYLALSGTVTITAGNTSATINISVIDDASLENLETVTITLDEISSGSSPIQLDVEHDSAELDIVDNDIPLLSIAGGGSVTEGNSATGSFQVTQSLATASDTVIAYTVTGTASSGSDFSPLSGTVTVPSGQTTATINVSILNDSLLEGSESIILTLSSITSGDARVAISPTAAQATLAVADDDTALVSIVAANDASEAGQTNGRFTLTLSALSPTDTVIAYSVAGTATAGTDYSGLPGVVTIPAGQAAATIDVMTLADSIVEPDETVMVSLSSITSGNPRISLDSAHQTATVTIDDDDTAKVRIAVTTAGNETGPVNIVFTVTQTAISSTSTSVNFSLGGTATSGSDFTIVSGPLLLPAGTTSATITVPVTDDTQIEGVETLIVTLTSLSGAAPGITIDTAAATATAEIADNDSALVRVTKISDGTEAGAVAPVFAISISAASTSNTTVLYTLGGTATAGADYTPPTTASAIIPAGQTSVNVSLPLLADTAFEGVETLSITLDSLSGAGVGVSIDPANRVASANIADDETGVVGIVMTTDGSETGPTAGRFTVTQNGTSATNTVVAYSITGTATAGSDYTALSGAVTIPAGQTSAVIDVPVLDDQTFESAESVIVTLTQITSGAAGLSIDPTRTSATLSIADNDAVTVSIASVTNANEAGAVNGRFTISQSAVTTTATVVNYTVGGTASSSNDFAGLSLTATIPAGQTSVNVDLAPLDDTLVEGAETVVLTLTSLGGNANAVIGPTNSATVQISDNDSATVGFSQTTSTASEASLTQTVTVRLTVVGGGTLDRAVTVNIVDTHTGTATAADYTLNTTSVTFAAGSADGATQNVVFTLVPDGTQETPDETVVLNLNIANDGTGGRVTLGSSTTHTLSISDTLTASGTISGFVWADGNSNQTRDSGELPVPGVTIRLTGTDSGGQAVDRTVLTDISGAYSFANVVGGTYTITERQPVAFMDGAEVLGTVAGAASGQAGADTFTGVVLGAGQQAINYNFAEFGLRAQYINQLMFLTSTSAATIQRIVQKTEPAASAAASTAPAGASASASQSAAVVSASSAAAAQPASSSMASAAAPPSSVTLASSNSSSSQVVTTASSPASSTAAVVVAAATPSTALASTAAPVSAELDDAVAALNASDYESSAIAAAIELVSASVSSHSASNPAQTVASTTDLSRDELTLQAVEDRSADTSRTELAVDCGPDSPRHGEDVAKALVDEALCDATSWLDAD